MGFLFGVLIPWEVVVSCLQVLGVTDVNMLPSAGIMLRTCSPSDKNPSVTRLSKNTPPYLPVVSVPTARDSFCSSVFSFCL